MTLSYGGTDCGVQHFSGALETMDVDDFKREFTIWCELQKLRDTGFNPYMVWRSLFGCLEGARLLDYMEF